MPRLDGLIPYRENSPAVERGIEMLDDLIEGGVETAARQLNLYFAAIDANLPLDGWNDADFSGFQTQR